MLSAAIGLIILVGSYGSANDTTFHTYAFDPASGSATVRQSLARMDNPSFLAVADSGLTVLAVNENGGPGASVTMMRRTRDDKYAYRPVTTVQTGGTDPCHIVVAPNGRYAVASNYSGGSISIIPFDGSKATFGEPSIVEFTGCGPVTDRQSGPHAHFTSFTPDGRLMITNDLGSDKLHVFPLDKKGFPEIEDMYDIDIEPGSGPRHLVYDRSGKNVYLINEISGTVTHLRYDKNNYSLTPLSYTLADYEHAGGSADIHLSPDGRFLYVTNRLKGDGIAIFAVSPDDGSLSAAGSISTGRHPRNFAITPDGRWLLVACRDDNRIEVFSRNPYDGSLTPTDNAILCPKPVCIVFQ